MNVWLKLINSAVKGRINEIVETENLLPAAFFGFRKNCSSVTCVNYFVNKITDSQAAGLQSVGIFIDVSQALDSVDSGLLLKTLAALNIPNKIVSWIHTYLSRRLMTLRTGEGEVALEVSEGLPQGCPLSPTLFNLYTFALHEIMEEDCELIQFADDFTVLVTGKTIEDIEESANNFLKKLTKKLGDLNLSINAGKTAAVVFSRKNAESLKIKIGQTKVQVNNTHKYLGYTLDRTLTHRKHIEDVFSKGAEKLGIIKLLGRRNGTANPKTLVKVGNAIIRSRYEYGAQVYGGAAKKHIQKMQTLQNSYLRVAMRYLKTTPIHVIHSETGQLPVHLRSEWLTIKEIVKSKFHSNQLSEFVHKAVQNDAENGTYLTAIARKHNDIVSLVHPKDCAMGLLRRRRLFDRDGILRINPVLVKDQKAKQNCNPSYWKQVFNEVKASKYGELNHLYTDAQRRTRELQLQFMTKQIKRSLKSKSTTTTQSLTQGFWQF